MKRVFLTKFALLLTLLIGFSSCGKNNDDEYGAFGTITDASAKQMTLLCDDGTQIEVYAEGGLSSAYNDKRAYVVYTHYDDGTTKLDDDFVKGELVDFAIYTTQGPSYDTGYSDSELYTKFGSNEIDISQVVYGGGYLHITYTFGYNDPYQLRSTTLVIDTVNSTDTDIYCYFYYLANDVEDDDYTGFSYETQSFVCINVNEYITDSSTTVTFHVETLGSSGNNKNVITVDSNNIPTVENIFGDI